MKKIKNFGLIGTILAVIAFSYGCFNYLKLKQEYNKVNKTYSSIIDDCIEEAPQNVEEDNIEKFRVNWTELKSVNQDAIAWIKIDDTNINYPIVQGVNNETYLKTDISGNYSKGGCLFVDCEIAKPFKTLNTIIYGHNLNDGSMFNNLKKYSDEEFARSHRDIKIYLPEYSVGIVYEVFAFCKIHEDNIDFYKINVDNLETYYQEISKHNQINIAENLDFSKPLIMLSTCTNENKKERYVVFASLK